MAIPIILLIAGIVLAMMEVLLPSGGVLGILATAAIIGSIIMAFGQSSTTGVVFLAMAGVLVPMVIIIGFKVFPKTPVGKKVILTPEVETQTERGSAGVSDENFAGLIGKTGKTITPLRPSGIAEIQGQRLSVVAEGEIIEANVEIVVVNVEGNSVVVDES